MLKSLDSDRVIQRGVLEFVLLYNEWQIVNYCGEYAAHSMLRDTSRFECYKCLLDGNYTLGLKMFAQGGLFMRLNAYIPEGGNEGGRGTTPTSILNFDYYDMKTL